MEITHIALLLDFIGKLCLGIMALLVHNKITSERKIDKKVLREMKLERTLGTGAIILFIISYILEFNMLQSL